MKMQKNEIPLKAEVNIGLIGHVDHGKTTLTEALSGKWTDTYSEELKRGISIRLGYADTVIRKCPKCPAPECYTTEKKCPHCGTTTEILRRVSFVDAPGHESLMATMISGAAIMDGAILVIAANEKCPQPQTEEHLEAIRISGIKNIIVVQNKIDLVSKEKAEENYKEIKTFLESKGFKDVPIIPTAANLKLNIDLVLEKIEEVIPTPKRDKNADPYMYIIRSFDINLPGKPIDSLIGGVIGGSVTQGVFKVGDKIEIRPGFGEEPIITEIQGIRAEGIKLEEAGPGGLIAMSTKLDPAVTKNDKMKGKIVGHVGKVPKEINKLKMKVHLLQRTVFDDKNAQEPIMQGEILALAAGTGVTVGTVTAINKDIIQVDLKAPICVLPDTRVVISRRKGGRWRLSGYGTIEA